MNLIENRHAFINNSLRIEILNKMICEKLESNESPETEHIEDLKKFLADHIEFLINKD